MPITVWATGRIARRGYAESPMCADARMVVPRASRFSLWTDRGQGQPGWDWGLNFTDLSDLVRRLGGDEVPEHARSRAGGTHLHRGNIRRLAIQVHGNAGVLFIDGDGETGLSQDNFESYRPDLVELGRYLTPEAEVLLMGCTVATNARGTRLLELLSGPTCWGPGRAVVGFTRTEIENDLFRRGETCRNPGVRLTEYAETNLPGGASRPHPNMQYYPWADNNSVPAKIGRNGVVVNHSYRDLSSDLGLFEEDHTTPQGWGINLSRELPIGGPLPPPRVLPRGLPPVRSRGRYRRPGPFW